MRVALVIEKFDIRGGGAERSTAQIAAELARRGHGVTVLAGSGCADRDLPYVVLRCHEHRRLNAWRMLRFGQWARHRLATGGFDASLSVTTAVPAHVVQPRSGTVRETLARNIAMRPTVAARWIKRISVQLSPKQRVLLALERQTMNDTSVRRFAAVSDYVARQLAEHYGIDGARVVTIPNAASMPNATAEQLTQWRKDLRRVYRVGSDETVFLFAALNPRLKGWPTLTAATALLVERGLKPVILAVGDFGLRDIGPIERAALRHCIRLIGPTGQMSALYAAADVTVLPTWYDPASKVVIESLMLGTPAITTRFNGAADMVQGGTHAARGRVIDRPDDAVALADAMAGLMDSATSASCRQACQGLADELSMTRHVDQLECVLKA